MKIRNFLLLCLLAAAAVFSAGCSSESGQSAESVTENVFAMDTYCTVTCYGKEAEEAAGAAADEISRIDDLFSVGNEDSEVSKINASGQGLLSEDAGKIIEAAYDIYERSDGAFDITVYPLMKLWGFTEEEQRVPSEDEISETLKGVGMDKMTYDEGSGQLILAEGQGIDFGGIAKGYAGDRIFEILDGYDIDSAIISLGGNIICYGSRPDGTLWRVGIEDPENPNETEMMEGAGEKSDESIALVARVENTNIITSGGYERYFTDEETGKTYCHIIDPRTGYPVEPDILSVTIVSPNGIYADALSTSCFLLGKEGSIEFWREYSDVYDFEMILICDDGKAYATEGIAGSCKDGTHTVEVIAAEDK